MFNRMKTSFLVIAAIALFFSTILIIGASFGDIAKAQEPSNVDMVHQEAVFNEVDHTAPALPDTINESVINEVDIIAPAMSVDTGLEESLHLKPAADTVDYAAPPAIPVDTESELTRWEDSHLKTQSDSVDYAAPETSVNSGAELSMWERLHFSK